MSDYIDRQAAIERLQRVKPLNGEDGSKDRYRFLQWMSCVEAIRETPAADVAPARRGRWEVFYAEELCGCRHAYYVCSNCFNSGDDEFDYCPNCGARMDGEEE